MAKQKVAAKINPARNLAVQLVYEVIEKGAYSNLALSQALRHSQLTSADRTLLTELVNGTVRMIKHLDWVLNLFLKQEISKQNPWLCSILRVCAYQLLFMDRIPDFAAVNDAVGITRRRCNESLARVANGVLRNLIRQKDDIKYPPEGTPEYLAVYYSHPQEMVDYLLRYYSGEDTVKILTYNNKPARLDFRVNSIKIEPEALMKELEREGVEYQASPNLPYSIRINGLKQPLETLSAYKNGYFYVQNEAAMLASSILGPEPGETVYDLCCGVGGKTTHLAELMNNSGLIRAYDSYPHKLEILKENCARLGISIVEAQTRDIILMETPPPAQKILLDVPCSGSGVLNRRSDARWKRDDGRSALLDEIQSSLLSRAASLLLPGGLLLYSTCSIRREENEEIINRFITENDNFILEGFEQRLSFFPLDPQDRESAASGILTMMPGKYEVDGMFYALLRRK